MDIEATCGCGATVKIHPLTRKASYGHDQVPDENERKATAEAFTEWVRAHSQCSRPQQHFVPPWPERMPEPASVTV